MERQRTARRKGEKNGLITKRGGKKTQEREDGYRMKIKMTKKEVET